MQCALRAKRLSLINEVKTISWDGHPYGHFRLQLSTRGASLCCNRNRTSSQCSEQDLHRHACSLAAIYTGVITMFVMRGRHRFHFRVERTGFWLGRNGNWPRSLTVTCGCVLSVAWRRPEATAARSMEWALLSDGLWVGMLHVTIIFLLAVVVGHVLVRLRNTCLVDIAMGVTVA